jgi:hypothetical protein
MLILHQLRYVIINIILSISYHLSVNIILLLSICYYQKITNVHWGTPDHFLNIDMTIGSYHNLIT